MRNLLKKGVTKGGAALYAAACALPLSSGARLAEAPGLRMAPQPARPHQKQEQIQGHQNTVLRNFH